MPRGTTDADERTARESAKADALECLRAFWRQPSVTNRGAVLAALDGYREEYKAELLSKLDGPAAPSQAPPPPAAKSAPGVVDRAA